MMDEMRPGGATDSWNGRLCSTYSTKLVNINGIYSSSKSVSEIESIVLLDLMSDQSKQQLFLRILQFHFFCDDYRIGPSLVFFHLNIIDICAVVRGCQYDVIWHHMTSSFITFTVLGFWNDICLGNVTRGF